MAPSREDGGCHGAGDGPPPQRAGGWRCQERERSTRSTTAYGHRSDLSPGCGQVSRQSPTGDGLPTLATPSLAGAAGEVVDAGTLAFLTRQAVEDKRKAKQSKEEAEAEKLGRGAVGLIGFRALLLTTVPPSRTAPIEVPAGPLRLALPVVG